MITDPYNNSITNFKAKANLTFQMEEELNRLLFYMKLCNILPDFSLWDEFQKLDKKQTKEALELLREQAISKTPASFENLSILREKEQEITAYVEEALKGHPLVSELIGKADKVVYINHYKDIFNTKGRDFLTDKKSGSFIIAANRDALIYPGAPFCQSFGNEHFYYASCVKNCIYNCDYCFLQGLYPCGYPVFFVNLSDYFAELEKILKDHSVYLCISYDTDLLALEPKLHYVEKWVEFAANHPDLKLEIRTKSGLVSPFSKLAEIVSNQGGSINNIIFAWTLTPPEVSAFAEKGLPNSEKRLEALISAKEAGFPVRICFDPMLYHGSWRKHYSDFFKYVFEKVPAAELLDVSVGVFRISNNLLKRMRNANPCSPITAFPYITEKGACHYGTLTKEMVDWARSELEKYISPDKIFAWEEKE